MLSEAPPGQRLHPISVLFGIGAAAWALLLVALFSPINSPFLIALLLIPTVFSSLLKYFSFRFWLGPDEMVIREGILNRNERHIPYARIQNVDLIQNLLHRLFQVAVVRLETASGGKPEAVISVLPLSTIEAMRAKIFRERDAEAAQADSTAEAKPPLLELPLVELATFGAISNKGMVMVAAGFGLAAQTGYFEDPRWLDTVSALEDVAPVIAAPDSPLLVGVLAVAGLLFVILLLRLFSVLWAIIKYYGFTLVLNDEDLRAEYGLLTRVTATIPRRRIQLVTLQLSLLHRWFERVSVQVDTAGGGNADQGQQGGLERQWLAPVLPRHEVRRFLAKVIPECHLERVAWQPISPRAWRRRFRLWLTLLAILTILAFFAVGPWGLLLTVPGLPLAFVHAQLYARRTGYALTPNAVLYRSGAWSRQLSIVPFSKIQALALTQSPFDRRNAMASVHADTAGATLRGHRIAISYLDDDIARNVLAHLDQETGRTAFQW
ncbi:MAG: PH domain-containing protein [Acidobacteriota bacterium]